MLRTFHPIFLSRITLVVVMITVDQWKALQLPCCASDTGTLIARRIV